LLQPDALDRRIMRELESPGSFQWNIRESYASVAKKVGVDEETVRKRANRMREAGILKGWQLIINPHILGRESASIELEVKDQSNKQAALSQIELMDGIISILDFNGPGIQVGVYYRSVLALEKQIALMEAICGNKHALLWHVAFPSNELKMKKTDWVLLSILQKDPRKKLSEISVEANNSTRTVNRRLGLMVRDYAFFLHAVIDFKKLGGLAYRMLLYSKDPEKKAKIDEAIFAKIETIEWSYIFSKEYSMFVVYCENVSEAKEISNFVEALDGVSKLTMDLIDDQITVQDWIEDEIEMKISSDSSEHS